MHEYTNTFTQTREVMRRQDWANRMTPVVLEVLGQPLTFKDDLKAAGIISGIVAVFLALAYVVMKSHA